MRKTLFMMEAGLPGEVGIGHFTHGAKHGVFDDLKIRRKIKITGRKQPWISAGQFIAQFTIIFNERQNRVIYGHESLSNHGRANIFRGLQGIMAKQTRAPSTRENAPGK